MEIQEDFKELLELLNAHKVEYMIVGGYALSHHGAPRYTGDIDIYVKPDQENSRRVINALDQFGFGSVGLTEEDFNAPHKVVQLGYPPVRIDIMTSLSGVSCEEAFSNKMSGKYGDTPAYFIGREQFLKNKQACGRKKDEADIEALGSET
ncbi:hypothetical protein JW926_16580 [Candidatus Sumerlaeota bacterium]|nr:hypothetical protein [Candidatus Sumerlaeota bacterium]